MKNIRAFSQGGLMAQIQNLPTRGLCFRLTFKWAAVTLAGGRFKYEAANAVKTATKHGAYRVKTLIAEKKLDFSKTPEFDKYTRIDWNETRSFVNLWGQGVVDADKVQFGGFYVEDQSIEPIWAYLAMRPVLGEAAVLGVFYGRANDNSPRGHVVAYCTRGAGMGGGAPCFFDANSGLWAFDHGEDRWAAMRAHVRNGYGGRWRIETFNTLVLKRR